MNIATEINEREFVQQTVDDAARFREAQEITKKWLFAYHIYIVQPLVGYKVIVEDSKNVGIYISDDDFPTYAQSLAFALTKAEERIKGNL